MKLLFINSLKGLRKKKIQMLKLWFNVMIVENILKDDIENIIKS